MGNDDFLTVDEINNITLDLEAWDRYACEDDYISIELPKLDDVVYTDTLYKSVQEVERELQEQKLREEHADLRAAWDEYCVLLEKYAFWDTLNK